MTGLTCASIASAALTASENAALATVHAFSASIWLWTSFSRSTGVNDWPASAMVATL